MCTISKAISYFFLPIVILGFSLSTIAQESQIMVITVEKPTFVLPQFTGPFREREASIAPEEYEVAERLRGLIENGEREAVMAELDEFYDIELSAAMLSLKAQIYFSFELFDKAEKTYLAVLLRKPQLVRVHADLGQLYLLKNDNKKAREYFANAISFGSNEALIHGQLAYLNLTMHGAFSAISEYQQAMALEPDNLQWQQGLLAALSQARMYESAQALIAEMLEKNPGDSSLWLSQAAISLRENNTSKALRSVEMAILLGDRDNNNLKIAAQLHLQLNSYDRALELLKESLASAALNMETLNEYLIWLGQVGMWSQAADLLNDAEKKLPSMSADNQSTFYLHRARILAAQNKNQASNRSYSLALEKNPANGHVLIEYAKFLVEQEQLVKAELIYSRAEAIPGQEKLAILGKAQLYINMRDYKSALVELRKAYKTYPELIDLKDNIEILENTLRAQDKVQI